MLLGLLFGAALLGIIIAVMEREGFPGWGKMILCVLAASVPAFFVNVLLPDELFIVGLAVGAVCAGFAISYATGMPVKRATVAAAIYFAVQVTLSTAFYFLAQ